jgi:hypothetical protein
MDEGTLKIPIPKCRLYLSFLFGVVKQFVGFESGQKQSVKLLQIMSTTQVNTPSPTATLIYCTFSLARGGGGQKKGRGATVHMYSFFVHGGNSSQAGSKLL